MARNRSGATAPAVKGNIVVGTGTDTSAVLAVGANGTTLVADSAEATGLKWATPASGSTFVGVSLDNTTTQTVTSPNYTAITWSTELFDTDGFHSTVTNTSRITIPSGKGGYYQVNGSIRWDDNTTGSRLITIYKNGTLFQISAKPGSSIDPTMNIQTIMYLVPTDYIEIFVYQNSGGNRTVYPYTNNGGAFNIGYLGA